MSGPLEKGQVRRMRVINTTNTNTPQGEFSREAYQTAACL
jgi:hypothetical protein